MGKKDYYEILGISKNAGERDIKKAYKRLAIKYHPDRNLNKNKNTENKFKEIKEAYEVLTDVKKRAAYDQYGHTAFDQNNVGSNFNNNSDFSDIFGEVFGDIFGRSHSNENKRGSDLCYKMELSLEEAVYGANKDIIIPALSSCNHCLGSGAKSGTRSQNCTRCNGTGQFQIRQGFFTVQQTCQSCKGNGFIIKNPCFFCKGTGRLHKTKKLSVKIPMGMDNGDRIRLPGEGEAGERGSSSGDLYVQIKIKKHPIFEREDNNLYCEVPIDFTMAALGGEIAVPTLSGKINLKIPKETQTGKLFRIRGKGIKSAIKKNNRQGDLLCRVIVETPVNLNEVQKKLLFDLKKSFAGSLTKNHSPRSKNFFEGVKKFFDNLTK